MKLGYSHETTLRRKDTLQEGRERSEILECVKVVTYTNAETGVQELIALYAVFIPPPTPPPHPPLPCNCSDLCEANCRSLFGMRCCGDAPNPPILGNWTCGAPASCPSCAPH